MAQNTQNILENINAGLEFRPLIKFKELTQGLEYGIERISKELTMYGDKTLVFLKNGYKCYLPGRVQFSGEELDQLNNITDLAIINDGPVGMSFNVRFTHKIGSSGQPYGFYLDV